MQQALCALAVLLYVAGGCEKRSPEIVIHPAKGAPVTVSVEVAETPEEVSRGLMYRPKLEPDHGMIFIFDAEKRHSFWMKNTQIPLDMIFIGRDGRIVGVHANAEPFSLAPIDVGKPSRTVLEVAGGWAAAHGIAPGDYVAYRNIDSSKLP